MLGETLAGPNILAVENAHFDALDEAFQRFAMFWYRHRGSADEIPPIGALDAPDAPEMWMGGTVVAAYRDDQGGESFCYRFAAAEHPKVGRTDMEGRWLAELLSERDAAEATDLYRKILHGNRPHYRRARDLIPGRDSVIFERVLAPFTDDTGQPAFLAGLWRYVNR